MSTEPLPPAEEFLEAFAQDIGDDGDPCSCHEEETGHPFLWFVAEMFQAPNAAMAWDAGERNGHHPTCKFHLWRDRIASEADVAEIPIGKPVLLPDGRIILRKEGGTILQLRKKGSKYGL